MVKKVFSILFTIILTSISYSQCAMCKAVVENNEENVGSEINTGIIFMIVVVYLILFFAFRKRVVKIFKEMKNIYD